jgi:hypothetical protein
MKCYEEFQEIARNFLRGRKWKSRLASLLNIIQTMSLKKNAFSLQVFYSLTGKNNSVHLSFSWTANSNQKPDFPGSSYSQNYFSFPMHTSKCSFYLPCLLIDAQMQTQYLWKTLQFKSKTNIASLNKANFQFSASGVGRRLCVLKGPIDFFKHRSKTKLGCYCQSSVSPPMGKTWRVCNPKLWLIKALLFFIFWRAVFSATN